MRRARQQASVSLSDFFHRLLLCLGALGCRMWRFTVNRAPFRWAAAHRVITGGGEEGGGAGGSAADVTAPLVWCHFVMSARAHF